MSDQEEVADDLYDRIAIVYSNIWRRKSKFHWESTDCFFCQYLNEVENNVFQLEKDMFRLVGFFVGFGTIIFEHINNISDRVHDYSLKFLIRKFKVSDDRTITNPVISISEIVAYFPFYVAEHLHLGGGSIFGDLYDIPRCLAFHGGLRLIPEGEEYETLHISWLIWRSRLDPDTVRSLVYTSYIHLEYISLIDRNRLLLRKALKYKNPSVDEVMKTIQSLLERTLAFGNYEGNILKCFKDTFPIYHMKIFRFYEQHAAQLFPFTFSN